MVGFVMMRARSRDPSHVTKISWAVARGFRSTNLQEELWEAAIDALHAGALG